MNDVIETPVEEVVVEAEALTGLAGAIDAEIQNLIVAKDLAVKLESGLTAKAELNRTAVAMRAILMQSKKSVHKLFQRALEEKKGLVGSISEVQKAAAKAKIEAKLKELGDKLAAL